MQSLFEPSSHPGRWSTLSGCVIAAMGAVLLIMPVGEGESGVAATIVLLFAAGLVELACGMKASRSPVRRIEATMSLVTLGAALFVLVRPDAYPLIFVASFCLGIRGVAAFVAAGLSGPWVRGWMFARGGIDIALAAVLMIGAPLAALISVISGVRWPEGAGLVLVNFIAVSLLATGLALVGIGRTHGRSGSAVSSAD